jgi:hypothetical protein
MGILRKILGALGVAAILIWLSVFSVQEYRPDNLTFEAQDKLPITSLVLDKLDFILAYLGQMPSLGLIPVKEVAGNYEQTMTEILTENKISENNLSQPPTVKDFEDFWQELKAKILKKSWSVR